MKSIFFLLGINTKGKFLEIIEIPYFSDTFLSFFKVCVVGIEILFFQSNLLVEKKS